MKVLKTNISDFSSDPFCRMDFDNKVFFKENDFSLNEKLFQYITFLETGKPISKEDYATEVTDNIHLVVRNIVDGKLCMNDPIYISEEKAEKISSYKILKGDIILAISANCGACFLYDEELEYNITLSHYLCRFRVNNNVLLPQFLVYYLNLPKMKEYFRSTETGKTQKNLAKVYVRNVPIYNINITQQKNAILKTKKIEKQMKLMHSKIANAQSIIDAVFAREFNFDYETFEELKKEKLFTSKCIDFANNPDLRFSVKFHRKAGNFVMQQLTNLTTKRIKHFLAEPIVLGASISPIDYNDDGDYYYISMATIKNWEFNNKDARPVFSSYAESKKEKTVKKNDILLARSGEGTIGKVAIIEDEDLEGVFADFTMRIRLKNYNPKFAYYYFRTTFFQYLIEVYKKGLGNNTNIFPIVIKEFPLLDISLDEQQRIVDEIKIEIDKQNVIKAGIQQLRSEIDKIIESAICS